MIQATPKWPGAVLLALAACMAQAQTPPSTSAAPDPAAAQGGAAPDDMIILLVPAQGQNGALATGCWARLYEDRNFKGDVATLVGPVQVDALDKGTARRLQRNIDSVEVGPKAILSVYEHKLFKDRFLQMGPNSREPSIASKLGITGRIESMRVDCAS